MFPERHIGERKAWQRNPLGTTTAVESGAPAPELAEWWLGKKDARGPNVHWRLYTYCPALDKGRSSLGRRTIIVTLAVTSSITWLVALQNLNHGRIRKCLASTMFKSILPTRRVPSTDFSIITNLVESQGKENQPTQPVQPQIPATKARSVSKGFMQIHEKKKKADAKRSKDASPPETPISGEAFDKLLVSCGELLASTSP